MTSQKKKKTKNTKGEFHTYATLFFIVVDLTHECPCHALHICQNDLSTERKHKISIIELIPVERWKICDLLLTLHWSQETSQQRETWFCMTLLGTIQGWFCGKIWFAKILYHCRRAVKQWCLMQNHHQSEYHQLRVSDLQISGAFFHLMISWRSEPFIASSVFSLAVDMNNTMKANRWSNSECQRSLKAHLLYSIVSFMQWLENTWVWAREGVVSWNQGQFLHACIWLFHRSSFGFRPESNNSLLSLSALPYTIVGDRITVPPWQ